MRSFTFTNGTILALFLWSVTAFVTESISSPVRNQQDIPIAQSSTRGKEIGFDWQNRDANNWSPGPSVPPDLSHSDVGSSHAEYYPILPYGDSPFSHQVFQGENHAEWQDDRFLRQMDQPSPPLSLPPSPVQRTEVSESLLHPTSGLLGSANGESNSMVPPSTLSSDHTSPTQEVAGHSLAVTPHQIDNLGSGQSSNSPRLRAPFTETSAPNAVPRRRADLIEIARHAFDDWEEKIRKTLDNPFLEFQVLDRRDPKYSRLFVAQHSLIQGDHYPISGSTEEFSSHSTDPSSYGRGHFLVRLAGPKKERLSNVDVGDSEHRIFVYLSSRVNMEGINMYYFKNRLQFIPLNPRHLKWAYLSTMFIQRETLHILPPHPSEKNALSLLLTQHKAGSSMLRTLQEANVIRRLKDDHQILALWSPVITSGSKKTIILHGIAQLDYRESRDTLSHLDNLAHDWTLRGGVWSATHLVV